MSSGAHANNPVVYGSHTNSFVLNGNETVEIILNNNDDGVRNTFSPCSFVVNRPQKHPFHLHGHAFQVVARSEEDAGSYWANTAAKMPSVPMRRDTVLVQPNGYAVLRFHSDNPGVWVFHCHIEWHVASGLIATFVEAPLEIQKTANIPSEHYDLCARNHPPIRTSGNAAGNDVDFLDLKGEPAPPALLPAGFTTKGIIALIISILNGLAMVAAIAWYGMSQAPGTESGATSADRPEGENQPLLAAAEQRDD